MSEFVTNPHGRLLVPTYHAIAPHGTGRLLVAGEGEWGNRCEAGHRFARPRATPEDPVDICTCGKYLSEELAILPEDATLLEDPNEAFDRNWWHVSHSAALALDPDQPVHLGSREAADDRANLKNYARENHGKSFDLHLYKIRLKGSARIHPDVLVERPGQSSDHTHALSLLSDWDVVRYVNGTEAPGSISLVVNARAVENMDLEIRDYLRREV
ncbi:hypothetical protein [Agromyces binzhouensis]|uniref:hypothetical protein n=1 Tax=Agromyces binzhouensis TaxID=1817495 RepID=UPI003634ADF2